MRIVRLNGALVCVGGSRCVNFALNGANDGVGWIGNGSCVLFTQGSGSNELKALIAMRNYANRVSELGV